MKITIIITTLIFSLNLLAQNTVEVKCDSLYRGKGIQIKLERFDDERDGYDGEKNSILVIEQNLKNKQSVIIKDSIFSSVQKIEFADFNDDKVKDILVQNISDVRSNWTYYLYLYNPQTNSFKRVKGFEEIKNPKYNSKDKIIESYVVSGKDRIGFYKIEKNKLVDLKTEIIDDHGVNFEKDYRNAIKKIKAKKQKLPTTADKSNR
jgi:hypothetical protein